MAKIVMNESIDKLIKESKNDINYLIKLKNEVGMNKYQYQCTSNIPSMSDMYSKYELKDQFKAVYDFNDDKKIITKRLKKFKKFIFISGMRNKNKANCSINNLAINHLILEFRCGYNDDENYGIDSFTELATLSYLFKFMNIKKITLMFSIFRFYYSPYDLFFGFLKYFLQKYCKDMDVIIHYIISGASLITNLGAGVNIIDENYASINKFQVNYHRNYQLKYRTN